eukprot:scaffold66155_cov61-Phaeocystis_antarctica.AAC.2
MAEALECPVCLTLPEGEVHQCHEGHCYCADCWNRLEEPRRCPECRQPVPKANRNRAVERSIAALEWSCEHCGEATTRGAMAAHLSACPQLPAACAAAAAGCGWDGVLAEQVAHEAACPFAICLRMMAPLQAQNQQLQAQCTGLQSECQELHAQNQQLQSRVRALEGEGEEGGRRQRQRVGPAPHDAPPSDAELEEIELADVVAALRAHVAVARVAEKACKRLAALCKPQGSEQAAAEAGVIEEVVEALRAHPQVAGVQEYGCAVLGNVCFGDDAVAIRQRAAAAGVVEVVVEAMRAHPQEENVQGLGCCALVGICSGGSGVRARRRRATQAGARTVAVAAMQAHPDHDKVQDSAQLLLDCLPAEA